MAGSTERNRRLEILRHSLGLDLHGRGNEYRNHYVAGPGHHSFDECEALVADGLMVRHNPRALFGGDYCFVVTDAGREWVRDHRPPPPPKLTRSQQRYRDFLNADCGLSFREWISR